MFDAVPPLIRLSNLFPAREVWAKCEFVAPSGSFKIRGALHLLDYLARTGEYHELVVPSMGNTALGAAVGCKVRDFRMIGVVPPAISRAKEDKLQALGVELIKIGGGGSALLRHAEHIAPERGGYFVHPHLDPQWTDGYQAIGEEILRDLTGCRSLVFPVGGGGLLMGLSEYLRRHPAEVKLFGCEPRNYPTYASFTHDRTSTIADGLILEDPHVAVQQRIDEMHIDIRLVEDDDIRTAMRALFEKHALVVEPSSAITLAFVQRHLDELHDPVCVILTGRNITEEDVGRLIAGPAFLESRQSKG